MDEIAATTTNLAGTHELTAAMNELLSTLLDIVNMTTSMIEPRPA